LRATDTLVRWGGDEFMIISIETELHTARQLAERLRASLESHSISDIGRITASFGVAQFEADDDFNSFSRRADDRLYVAKTQGRNRVA
jgi:diguanylate cyclase (GGDEF)-like protein